MCRYSMLLTITLIFIFTMEVDIFGYSDHFSTGFHYMEKGKYEEAIVEFKKMLEENPTHGPSYSNLAICYERENMHKEAESMWRQYVQLVPIYSPRVEKHLSLLQDMKKAKVFLEANQIEKAIPLLKNISEDTSPKSGICIQAIKELAHYYFSRGDYKYAISYFERIEKEFYIHDLTDIDLFEYAESLVHLGKFNLAIDVYRRLNIEDLAYAQKERVDFGLGISLLNLGRYEQAKQFFKTFIDEYSTSVLMPDVIRGLGICFEETKEISQGMQFFESFCQKKPTNVYVLNAKYQIAYYIQIQGNYESAIDLYQEILTNQRTRNDLMGDILYQMGIIYYTQKKYRQAEENFQKFIELFPKSQKNIDALYYMAESIFNEIEGRKGEEVNADVYDQVINRAKDLIVIYPGTKRAYDAQYLMAKCYDRQKKYVERDDVFEDYVKKGINYYNKENIIQITKQMADAYFHAGMYREAIKFYRLIIANFPKSSVINDSLQMLGKGYEKLENFNEALSIYHNLLERLLKSEKASILESIGDIYRIQGKHELALLNYRSAGESYKIIKRYNKSIEIFKMIINTYPDYKKITEIYILLTESYMWIHKYVEAIECLRYLIKQYPDSYFTDRAQYLIANCYLLDRKYHQALVESYKLLEEYPKSPYREKAQYLIRRVKKLSQKDKE